ncbi:MAG TPA: peptidoglycan bridge formation glycyltransferase FemA/FemB family protein [Flavobacterium sp.]|jgi:lipid II:glycine glycyltransferase (peptidoglycan interpeptide bridge formation enzyme)
MELIFTKESEWLKKWDDFIQNEDKGSHLLLSAWLKSFRSFGFDFEVCLLVDNNKIVGGYGAVLAKAALFKFYIIPYGPIVAIGFEHAINDLISSVSIRAKFHKCCYCHITLPISDVVNQHAYHNLPPIPALDNAATGHLFKYVYSSNGLNWINLNGFTDEESLLESFRPSVRRYIRSSQRKGLDIRLLKDAIEIQQGYELCLANAEQNNYSLRSWNAFNATLFEVINDGTGKFYGAFKDGVLKGAALVVGAGNYDTYILGGTAKEKPDLLVGHFLHWNAIKSAYTMQLTGYNISLGGSAGVVDFKNSYANEQIMFTGSKFHWITKPFTFRIYQLIEKRIKPYKSTIARIFSKKQQ